MHTIAGVVNHPFCTKRAHAALPDVGMRIAVLDKIKRSQLNKQVELIRKSLHLTPSTVVIPFSAQTKQGRDEIYALLDDMLAYNRECEFQETEDSAEDSVHDPE